MKRELDAPFMKINFDNCKINSNFKIWKA